VHRSLLTLAAWLSLLTRLPKTLVSLFQQRYSWPGSQLVGQYDP